MVVGATTELLHLGKESGSRVLWFRGSEGLAKSMQWVFFLLSSPVTPK